MEAKEELQDNSGQHLPSQSAATPPNFNMFSIISAVCGIIGFLIFPIFLGPLAIFTGAMAYSQITHNPPQRGLKLAIIGVFLGVVDIISLVLFLYSAT